MRKAQSVHCGVVETRTLSVLLIWKIIANK